MSEKILLDAATRSQLLEMQKEVVRIQWAMQLIISTYCNARGLQGDYRLSPDFSTLERVEPVEPVAPADEQM